MSIYAVIDTCEGDFDFLSRQQFIIVVTEGLPLAPPTFFLFLSSHNTHMVTHTHNTLNIYRPNEDHRAAEGLGDHSDSILYQSTIDGPGTKNRPKATQWSMFNNKTFGTPKFHTCSWISTESARGQSRLIIGTIHITSLLLAISLLVCSSYTFTPRRTLRSSRHTKRRSRIIGPLYISSNDSTSTLNI